MKNALLCLLVLAISACARQARELPPTPSPLAQLRATVSATAALPAPSENGATLCVTEPRIKAPLSLNRFQYSYDNVRYMTVLLPREVADDMDQGVVSGVRHQAMGDAKRAGWSPVYMAIPDDTARRRLYDDSKDTPAYAGMPPHCQYVLVVEVYFEHAGNTAVVYTGDACRKAPQSDPSFAFYCGHGGRKFWRITTNVVAGIEAELSKWDSRVGRYAVDSSCPRSYDEATIPMAQGYRVSNVRELHNASSNMGRHAATAAWGKLNCS